MNIREYIKEKYLWEGRQEGWQERSREVILNMLKEKLTSLLFLKSRVYLRKRSRS